MIKILLSLLVLVAFTSCASIKENMPKRQACTGDETNKTLAELACKKK